VGTCSRQLPQPGHHSPDAKAVELLGLLRRELIFASGQLVESRNVHAALKGTSHLGDGEAGGVPLVARPEH